MPDQENEQTQVDNTEDTKDEPLNEGGLKALQAERKLRSKTEKELKAFKAKFDGIDPETYQTLVSKLDEVEDEKLKAAGDWESKQTKLKTVHDQELSKVVSQLNDYKSKYENLVITDQVKQEFYKAGGRVDETGSDSDGFFSMLLPLIKPYLSFSEEGTLQATDKAGEETTVAKLIESAKTGSSAILFKSAQPSGGGSQPNRGRPPVSLPANGSNLTPLQKALAARGQ